ncbi:hypothetical protein WNY77_10160 [Paraglaciecola mesophila]|uniref:Rap1a immunity protein domain-containing protein n=1 Tax=Paraglaciecola mesophila TaxID=197222 RepID=A0ABU9SV30_9ALTE
MCKFSISKIFSMRLYNAVFLALGFMLISHSILASTNNTKLGVWQNCQNLKHQSEQRESELSQVVDSTCYQFIKGFLHGAVLTDTQIMRGLESESDMNSFSKRAIRTRLGSSRATDADTYLAQFCLPNADVDPEVVMSIVSALPNKIDASKSVAEEIYQAIKTTYPCQQR